MESKKESIKGRIGQRRIIKDIKEVFDNPQPNITYWSDETNMNIGHTTIIPSYGPYKDMLIHVKIILPSDYPQEPPAAYIEGNFPFDHRHHEHVHGGGSICCDLTSNFKFFFSSKERSGWSSACSLLSLLMQLSTFFSDIEFIEKSLSQEKIEQLRLNIASYKCDTCGHSTEKPVPEFIKIIDSKIEPTGKEGAVDNSDSPDESKINSKEDNSKIDIRSELLSRLICGTQKLSLLDDPTMIIGYPINIKRDRHSRIYSNLVLEYMSYDAFIANISLDAKLDYFDLELTSPMGQKYNYWMPIFINNEHFRKSLQLIKNSLSIIKFGTVSGSIETDFKPEHALDILCCLINKTVVSMLNGTMYESTNAIIAYTHLLRLLLAFAKLYPVIQNLIEGKIRNFIQSNKYRNKKVVADIGEFIIICFLSRAYKFTNIKEVLIREYYARQIYWMNKVSIYPSRLTEDKLQLAFDACKISNQLLVFAIESAKAFITDSMCDILDSRYGFAHDGLVTFFQNRIKEIKTKVVTYQFLAKIVGMPIDSNASMLAFLKSSEQLSKLQNYTR